MQPRTLPSTPARCTTAPPASAARAPCAGRAQVGRATLAGLAALALVAAPAAADDTIPGHRIDRPAAALVLGGAIGAGFGLSLIPIDLDRPLWQHELLGSADDRVHDRFSTRAAAISDGLLIAAVAAPLLYLTGTTIEDADGDRLLIYGEAMAINLALNHGIKRLIQRPRPYLYSRDPEVARYAASQGDDSRLSFYSGHAAVAFCAATAGGYLVAASAHSPGVRAIAWAGGFAVAAATADLRVRAGKHFYSDVVAGALVGIAIGYAVPALHADARPYVVDLTDLGAATAGILGGALIAELLPLAPASPRPGADLPAVSPGRLSRLRRADLQLAPIPLRNGAGIAIAGSI
jgi:membrane-associated phospholipid phosphatase